MKKNFVKILTVLLCMVSLVVMLALPCFADSVPIDGTLVMTIQPISDGEYGGGLYIAPDTNIGLELKVDDTIYFSGNVYKVVIQENDLMLNIAIYETESDYSDLTPTFNIIQDTIYDEVTVDGVSYYGAVLRFTGVTSYGGSYDGVTFEVLLPPTHADGIIGVFSNISGFAVSALAIAQGAFFDGSNLTLLGTLAVIGLSIALAFLLLSLIERFLHLRG